MTRGILLLMIICVAFACKKQQKNDTTHVQIDERPIPPPPPEIIDENNLVGFACGYAGKASKPVLIISKILQSKDYTQLTKKLYNVHAAEKYLATVACERLAKENLIELITKDLNQIATNKSSAETVGVCGGCTYREKLSLKELFSSDNTFSENVVNNWLNKTIQ